MDSMHGTGVVAGPASARTGHTRRSAGSSAPA